MKRFVFVTACLIQTNYQSESMVGKCCRDLTYIEPAAKFTTNPVQGRWWKDLLKWVKIITSSRRNPSKHETLNQCWADVGPALQTLVNISPAFVQCLMFAGTALSQAVTHSGEGPQQIRDIDHVLVQCRPIVSDAGSTLKQHKSNVTYLLEGAMAPIAVLLYSWWGVTDLIVCIHTPTPNPPPPPTTCYSSNLLCKGSICSLVKSTDTVGQL